MNAELFKFTPWRFRFSKSESVVTISCSHTIADLIETRKQKQVENEERACFSFHHSSHVIYGLLKQPRNSER